MLLLAAHDNDDLLVTPPNIPAVHCCVWRDAHYMLCLIIVLPFIQILQSIVLPTLHLTTLNISQLSYYYQKQTHNHHPIMKIISALALDLLIVTTITTTKVSAEHDGLLDNSELGDHGITCAEGVAASPDHAASLYFPMCNYQAGMAIAACEPDSPHCSATSGQCDCAAGVASCAGGNVEHPCEKDNKLKVTRRGETIHAEMEGCQLHRRGTHRNEFNDFKRFFEFDCEHAADE